MTNFKISNTVDSEKIFFVNSSEIDGRLDPLFYVANLFGFINNSKYPIKRIGECIKNLKSGFGVGRQDQVKEDEGVLQIRPTNLGNFGTLKFNRNVYVPKNLIPSEEHFLEDGDVLFNNTNSQELVGKTAIFFNKRNKQYTFSNHITVLKVDKTKLLSEYLWLLLNTYQRGNIFYSICTNWNNQSGIGIELLKSLKIPVPNLDEQKEVVNKFNLALSANKKKETKAQKLLDGIDEYLLNELGIKLPEQDNSLKSRVFITNFSEVSGGRLDAYYYQEVFKNILIRLKQSRYDLVSLRQIINDVTNGVEIRTYSETGIRYLRVTDLSKIGVVNHNRRFVDIEDIPQKIKLRKEDFLISRSGSLGLVNIVTDELSNSILSSHIFRVNLILNFVSPLYLQEYLRSYVGQSQFFMRNNGGVIPEINQGALKSIKIILPPLSKQEEIANHISKIREQAKKLQKEAVAVLENAKVEIEKIIMSN